MARYRKKLWDSTILGFGISVGFGLLCGFICCIICSAMSYFIFNAMMFGGIFTVLCLGVSGYFSGYLCGRYRRRYGLFEGAICGGIIYGILLVVSLYLGEFTSITKLILLVVCGGTGGVAGVNTERPERLM